LKIDETYFCSEYNFSKYHFLIRYGSTFFTDLSLSRRILLQLRFNGDDSIDCIFVCHFCFGDIRSLFKGEKVCIKKKFKSYFYKLGRTHQKFQTAEVIKVGSNGPFYVGRRKRNKVDEWVFG
jgi:hypothetical protein